jgi:hypothetical protein
MDANTGIDELWFKQVVATQHTAHEPKDFSRLMFSRTTSFGDVA